jgi:hypothetical protein
MKEQVVVVTKEDSMTRNIYHIKQEKITKDL